MAMIGNRLFFQHFASLVKCAKRTRHKREIGFDKMSALKNFGVWE
jgi:hypothetical protein